MRRLPIEHLPRPRGSVRHRAASALICALAVTAGLGCATPRLETPSGYVELEDHFGVADATYKAVSADGGVLLVRLLEDQPAGALPFWTDAFTSELVEGRGYELLEQRDVTRVDGRAGKIIVVRGTHNQLMYRYSVAIYLEDEDIVTVESTIGEEKYEEHSKRILSAVESLTYD